MNPLLVPGCGAVSPAGWGVAPLLDALRSSRSSPPASLPGPPGHPVCQVRTVPPPNPRPPWAAHPRLRRSSAISHFAMAAALEALETSFANGFPRPPAHRLGIVVSTQAASLRFSERFFAEVLCDPATASPVLFPETVINAPASHLAAVLGGADRTYSLTGDATVFMQALVVAGDWLLDDHVDLCLVVGAEECGWPVAKALSHHARGSVPAEGAGALVLTRPSTRAAGPVLERVTGPHLHAGAATRAPAACALRAGLPPPAARELLVDSRCGIPRLDRPEAQAWADWTGPVWSPRRWLGEALAAAAAWQCVAACAVLGDDSFDAVNVSVVGFNAAAAGARFLRLPP